MGKKSLAEKEKQKAREARLQRAIANDDVVEVHNLIREERELLDRVSKHPFPDTPLHLAAEAGKTHVAMEMAILKPSFVRKLNPEGYSPMHLALQHKHYQTVRALMTLDPELIRVRGRGGITPLHFVAGEKGYNKQEKMVLLELLAEFLFTCKSSIEDLTNQCETTVHIAVKMGNNKAFKILFGWLKRVYLTEILNWKDEDGNTVLHIAVLKNRCEIINQLSGCVKLNARNFQDETALEMLQADRSGDLDLVKKLRKKLRAPILSRNLSLSEFLGMQPTMHEKFVFKFGFGDESNRNIILLVAALITTATYTAMLTPPGGYWSDNSSNLSADSTVVTAHSSGIAAEKPHRAGNIILSGSYLYAFTALNSWVFLISILTICTIAIPLLPESSAVCSLMFFLGFTYFTTFMMEFPRSNAAVEIIMMVCAFILLLVSLAIILIAWFKHHRILRGIDATGRRVSHFPELKHGK